MKAWGILVAAGSGERLGAGVPKAFVELDQRPMFVSSLPAMLSVEYYGTVEGVVVVVPSGWEERAREAAADYSWREIRVVAGGETRQDSVRAGLAEVPSDADAVIVHDAARPMAWVWLFENVMRVLAEDEQAAGAICATPVHDTVKRAIAGTVIETLSRDGLWLVQTPQAFRADVLRRAHAEAVREAFVGTDDASLVERLGERVVIVEGRDDNRKITNRQHLNVVKAQGWPRVGVGFDAHALVEGKALMVGGMTIPYERGSEGHSDGDVLLHAICDALLGAMGMGDMGQHFPSSDERWRGAASEVFVADIMKMVRDGDHHVAHVDATVIIQEPRMEPFRDEVRRSVARLLQCDPERVSLKATTTDNLGIVGHGEGLAAQAVVVLGVGSAPSRIIEQLRTQ